MMSEIKVEGLETIPSSLEPTETMNRLETAIKAHGMTVFTRINHAALAAEAGLTLGPTELIVFGDPKGGTLLMQAKQTIGIDLPLKALVWQDAAGKTWLSFNELDWLAQRHRMDGVERIITKMKQGFSTIASQATLSR